MILREIAELLKTSQVVRDVIADRIFFDRLPDGVDHPVILLNTLTTTPLDDIGGKPTHDQSRIQIDLWAIDHIESEPMMRKLGDAVRTALEGFKGDTSGLAIQGAQLSRDDSQAVSPPSGAGAWRLRRSMDFVVTHRNRTGV